MKYSINRIILIVAVSFLSCSNLCAQHWEWVETIGQISTGNDVPRQVVFDDSLNLYVTGRTKGDAVFGSGAESTTTLTYGQQDIFLAKYNKDGVLQWVTRNGGPQADYGWGIAVLGDLVYLTGYYTDVVDFEGQTLGTMGKTNGFIAQYDRNGNLNWVRSMLGSNRSHPRGLSLSGDSLIAISGYFNGTMSYDGDAISSAGGYDMFLMVTDTAGNVRWMESFGGTSDDYGQVATFDHSGDILMGGIFRSNPCWFGTMSTGNSGNTDAAVAKFDQAGNGVWLRKVGSGQADDVVNISVDSANNVYSVGYHGTTATFKNGALGDSVIVAVGDSDGYMVKYSSSGTIARIKRMSSLGFDQIQDVLIQPNNEMFICGEFEDTLFIASDTILPIGPRDIFVSKLDSNMNNIWFKQVEGYPSLGYYPWATSLISDSADYCYVVGGFKSTAAFDANVVTAGGSTEDGFVGRITPMLMADVTLSDTLICIGDSVDFSVNTVASVTAIDWTWGGGAPGVGTGSGGTVTYNYEGTYGATVAVTDGWDTLIVNSALVQVDSIFLNLPVDTAVCGDSLLITAMASTSTVLWDNADTTLSTWVYSSGMYYVEANVGVCNAIDSIQAELFPLPTPYLGVDTIICDDDSLLLNPGMYSQYTWNTGATTSIIYADTAGSYYVQVEDANGCFGSDTIDVQVQICSGVQEEDLDNAYIYVESGKLSVVSDQPGQLTMFDLSGRQCISEEIYAGTTSISPNVPAGVYVCRLILENGGERTIKLFFAY